MMPDLNSLPPSRSPASSNMPRLPFTSDGQALRGQTPSPSPRSASTSLQAAAAVNAGLQHEDSRRSSTSSVGRRQSMQTGRRRSAVMMNLQFNDPAIPSPGEMASEHPISSYSTSSPDMIAGSPIIATGDPHHMRNPSLGELHQELEQEQEAQVNRLLQMIRAQQQQLQQLQAAAGGSQVAVIDEPITPRSPNFSTIPHPRSSLDLRRSRTPSRTASPQLGGSSSIGIEGVEGLGLGGRDESAFYQAETQMLTRENQMLRMRIRELERQINELHANSAITHEPATPSNLATPLSVSEEENPAIAGSVGIEAEELKLEE